ncbi:exosome non-catalytic core subunit rrp46 [Saitoella coloradoensis]
MSSPTTQTSLLHRADGSSTWSHGPTKLLCSVNGPMEVRLRDEQVDKATIEVIVRPAVGASGTHEKSLERKLLSAISPIVRAQLHPRTHIQITIQIISSPPDGNVHVLAAGINAACMALMDAGIPMSSTIAAVAIGVDEQTGAISRIEDVNSARSTHVICYENVHKQLVLCESLGDFSEEEFFACLEAAREACEGVYETMREGIREKVERNELWKEA